VSPETMLPLYNGQKNINARPVTDWGLVQLVAFGSRVAVEY